MSMLFKCLTAYIEMNSDLTGTFYHVLTTQNICIGVVRKCLASQKIAKYLYIFFQEEQKYLIELN